MNHFETFLQGTGISFFYFKLILGFFFSFIITYISIPTIIKISRRKNLMDEPGARSSHLRKIPNLGGIAIFFLWEFARLSLPTNCLTGISFCLPPSSFCFLLA